MKSRTIPARSEQIDYVSSELLPRAALLTRLLVRQLGGEFSRTEIGLLKTLGSSSRRITELAVAEGLAQPTVTILIKQLEGNLAAAALQLEQDEIRAITAAASGATQRATQAA